MTMPPTTTVYDRRRYRVRSVAEAKEVSVNCSCEQLFFPVTVHSHRPPFLTAVGPEADRRVAGGPGLLPFPPPAAAPLVLACHFGVRSFHRSGCRSALAPHRGSRSAGSGSTPRRGERRRAPRRPLVPSRRRTPAARRARPADVHGAVRSGCLRMPAGAGVNFASMDFGSLNAAPVRYSSPSTHDNPTAIRGAGGPASPPPGRKLVTVMNATSASNQRLIDLRTERSSGRNPSFSKRSRVSRARRPSSTAVGVTPAGCPSTSSCAPGGSEDTTTL